MTDRARRRFLARVAAALALPAVTPPSAVAQTDQLDPQVRALTKGAPLRQGRVKLELPLLADNGNAVPLSVSVDSPMSADDYVKSIHLFSQRNPVRDMARFYLTPRSGRARVSTRVRLAGSQNVTAVVALSDGTFWADSVHVQVTLSACVDES